MGKVFKKLFFEIPVKTAMTVLWSIAHPIDALKFIWKSEKYCGYGFASLATFVLSPKLFDVANLNGWSWYIPILAMIFSVVIPGWLLSLMETPDEKDGIVPKRNCTKYFKWAIGLIIASLLALGVFLHVIPIVPLIFFLVITALINYFLGPKQNTKPVELPFSPIDEKKMKTLTKTINYFIYYGVFGIGLVVLMYFWLPNIMPYITHVIEHCTSYITSVIEYYMTHFG